MKMCESLFQNHILDDAITIITVSEMMKIGLLSLRGVGRVRVSQCGQVGQPARGVRYSVGAAEKSQTSMLRVLRDAAARGQELSQEPKCVRTRPGVARWLCGTGFLDLHPPFLLDLGLGGPYGPLNGRAALPAGRSLDSALWK